ncbi:UNVERIFIED_CONTAM: hypothetical protein GTU68_064796 [Idotea baltica]|nr:hypothetical protein [Idotea baltica]
MSQPEHISLYLTEEHQCSYLPEEIAQTAFVDPSLIISEPIYSSLNQQGFRRSGSYFYRPQCQQCNRCTPLRVKVSDFKPSRSQKRCLKANQSLSVSVKQEVDIWSYYNLYSSYIEHRHRDGDMHPPVPDQYESFLGESSNFVRYAEFHDQDRLVMVAVMDQLADALSAIYTFFDPKYESLGLGNYAVLWQLQHAKTRGIPYLYLGYWIEDCGKMNYKSKYKPNQMLIDGSWKSSATD